MNTKAQIAEILDESERYAEAEEGLLSAKVDVSMKAVSILLTELKDGINTLFEGMAGIEHYDKGLGSKLQITISEAINKFTQVKHEINFAPSINVDFAPLQTEINRSTAQSKLLYGLIEKFSNGTGKQEELFKLIVLIGQRQVEAFEKINSMADIRPELNKINETLNKPRPTDFDIEVTKRDPVRGFFEKAVIKATNGR